MAAGPPVSQAPAATQSAPGWVSSILAGVAAPVTQNNVNKLAAWNACEGNESGGSGLPINNPFNTTLSFGGGSSVNSAGVKHYPSIGVGISATLQTLAAGRYNGIVTNLQQDGSGSAFASAVGSSGWGTNGSCIARSLGVAAAQGGTGTTASSSSSGSSSTGGPQGSGCNGCAINLPSVAGLGGGCLISGCNLKALKGGLLVVAGGALFVVGGLVLVAYGLGHTAPGRAAAQAYQATPARGALKAVGARRTASRSVSQTRAREQLKTEELVTRQESAASTRRYGQTRPRSEPTGVEPGRIRTHRGRRVNQFGEELL